MSVTQFIKTGMLELYVLHALSEEEMKVVEEKIALFPVLQKEIEEIEKALCQYAILHKEKPSPTVLKNVLQRIDKETQLPVLSSYQGWWEYGYRLDKVKTKNERI